MMSLIWYGVFERFPTLRVVHVEADAGWVPYLLQRMEQHWEFSGNAEHPDLKMPPTEYFRRNVFVACRGDECTLPSVVELAGDDNLTFNTDYPHPDGTWPWGMRRLEKQPISDDEQAEDLGRERRPCLRSRMRQTAATASPAWPLRKGGRLVGRAGRRPAAKAAGGARFRERLRTVAHLRAMKR